jgi:hypothetical protein
MIIKANGHSALIAVTGLFVLCVSPLQAETDTETSTANSKSDNEIAAPMPQHNHLQHAWHHRRSDVPRRSHAIETKADADKSAKEPAAANIAADDSKILPDIPPLVANANARMLLAGIQLSTSVAIPMGIDARAASDPSAAAKADNGTLVVSADQLNDVDRSLREGGQVAATSADPPPGQTIATTSEVPVWDQTSLIGKIFIGFGTLLTMASAARMFMT